VLPTLTPSTVAFGEQNPGTVSGPQTVTITNRGAASVRLAGVAVDGPFRTDGSACAVVLAPGAVCRVAVSFAPTGQGAQSGALRVNVPDVSGRAAVALTGTGAAPTTAAVPGVVGGSLTAAQRSIEAAGLRLGTVTRKSDVAADGTVLGQTPAAGATPVRGSAVDLVVSSGPVVGVAVPELVGRSEADAVAQLTAVGLRVGTIERRADPKVAAGAVIATDPATGTSLPPGSAVGLVVSTGIGKVPVPDVAGTSQAQAQSLITDAKLAVGAVTTQASDTVAKGVVISSTPAGGTQVAPGSAVRLVVSSGPAPVVEPAPKPVAVPGVAGRPVASARAMITDAKLVVGQVRTQASDSVAKGVVISSTPAGGTEVASGTRVGLVVSSGPAPVVEPVAKPVVVPGVIGSPVASARAMITDADLVVGQVKTQPSDKVAKGVVIGSTPAAGARVAPGTRVGLVVSSGPAEAAAAPTAPKPPAAPQAPAAPKTPAVPQVVGLTVAQATAALQEAGLRAVVVDTDGNPATAGTVVAASAPKNKRVTLTVQASQ
jgi:beta-lactam-binding protein with PASTA domain